MGTHNCAVCSEPVDLTVDRCDETGDPVHKQCYLGRITGKSVAATPIPEQNIIQAFEMRVIAAISSVPMRPLSMHPFATSENGGR
jgi:hypothetical protein